MAENILYISLVLSLASASIYLSSKQCWSSSFFFFKWTQSILSHSRISFPPSVLIHEPVASHCLFLSISTSIPPCLPHLPHSTNKNRNTHDYICHSPARCWSTTPSRSPATRPCLMVYVSSRRPAPI